MSKNKILKTVGRLTLVFMLSFCSVTKAGGFERRERLVVAQFQSALILGLGQAIGYVIGSDIGTGVKFLTTAGTTYAASMLAIEASFRNRYKYTGQLRNDVNTYLNKYSSSQIAMLASVLSVLGMAPSILAMAFIGAILPEEVVRWGFSPTTLESVLARLGTLREAQR